jgi:hypothetical protein
MADTVARSVPAMVECPDTGPDECRGAARRVDKNTNDKNTNTDTRGF